MSEEADIERAFHSLAPGEVDGAFLLSPSLRLNFSKLTIGLAAEAKLPVQAHRREWVERAHSSHWESTWGPSAPPPHGSSMPSSGARRRQIPRRGSTQDRVRDQSHESLGTRHRGATGRDRPRRQGLSVGNRRLEQIEWLRLHGRITA